MDVNRLLHSVRTSDLYAKRGEELNFGPVGIDTRFADISPDEHGEFVTAYYAEAGAEIAVRERGCDCAEGGA